MRRLWFIAPTALLAIGLACASSIAQIAPPPPPGAGPGAAGSQSIEDEVLSNLKAQPIDDVQTLEDYQLPDAFLRTLSDRVIRSSFEDQFRMVVRDGSAGSNAASGAGESSSGRSRAVRWLGLVILIPVAIAGWVLLRRKKATS